MNWLKNYKSIIIGCIVFLVTGIGMIVYKSKLEYDHSDMDEFYFNAFRWFFILTLIYLVIEWIFKKWRAYQVLKNDKMNADLLHLKNQISPHFFFNTLNTLYGLIKKDADGAQQFVLQLSDLMRYSIYGSDNGKVPIEKEVTYLRNFIDLNKIRYQKSIEITFKENINDQSFQIHPLLLIVLVENAFKHGVEKSIHHAYVHVELNVHMDIMHFTVKNNYDPKTIKNSGGVGLNNLRQRLALLYPERHLLRIEKEGDTFKTHLEIGL